MIKAKLNQDLLGKHDDDIIANEGDEIFLLSKVIAKEEGEIFSAFLYYNISKDYTDLAHVSCFQYDINDINSLPKSGFKGNWDPGIIQQIGEREGSKPFTTEEIQFIETYKNSIFKNIYKKKSENVIEIDGMFIYNFGSKCSLEDIENRTLLTENLEQCLDYIARWF